MPSLLRSWSDAAITSVGYFWMALWAFVLGYLVSSAIQVFVTRERIHRAMGSEGPRAVGLGAVFGLVSSSCSFAALATTRTLFAKGAGLAPALAFLLGSTNLVIELGVVIAVFLSWQFVVGEYVGGVMLIGFTWLLVRLTQPTAWVEAARKQLDGGHDDGDVLDWRQQITSLEGWGRVARQYRMEWQMVWKDVTIGFTAAGLIRTFVPRSFFEGLFVGTDGALGLGDIVAHAAVAPVAAMFTFIGSMGNIPLAAVLYDNGVSFAGVMGFLFSDLIVVPVLRIHTQYYGWRLAAYIAGLFYVATVLTATLLHLGFDAFGWLPEVAGGGQQTFFAVDHTLFLNLFFVLVTAGLAWIGWRTEPEMAGHGHGHGRGGGWFDQGMTVLAIACFAWLIGGLVVAAVLS